MVVLSPFQKESHHGIMLRQYCKRQIIRAYFYLPHGWETFIETHSYTIKKYKQIADAAFS